MDETLNMDEIDHMFCQTIYCAAIIEQYHEWNFHHIDGHSTIVDENDGFDSIAMHESFHMGEIQWSDITIWMKFNTEVKLVHGWKQDHVTELDDMSEIDHKDRWILDPIVWTSSHAWYWNMNQIGLHGWKLLFLLTWMMMISSILGCNFIHIFIIIYFHPYALSSSCQIASLWWISYMHFIHLLPFSFFLSTLFPFFPFSLLPNSFDITHAKIAYKCVMDWVCYWGWPRLLSK